MPASFVTLDGLRRHGWKQVPSGWLVESSRPLTSDQIAAARELAAEAGLTIETQRGSTSLATPIAIATAAGALLALAILAMTVGLIRSESAGDLRTLTATGATSRIAPYADGRHRRRARPPRRAPRRRRRLLALAATYSRRPRLPRSDPGAPPRRHRRRRAAGGRCGRLAPRRTRAACDRPPGDRVTGLACPARNEEAPQCGASR